MKTTEINLAETMPPDDTTMITRVGDAMTFDDGEVPAALTLEDLAARRPWKVGGQVRTICGLGDSNTVWGLDGSDRSFPYGSFIYRLHKHLIGHPQFWGVECRSRARSGYTSTNAEAEFDAGTVTITGASNATPGTDNVTITAAAHGFSNGEIVELADVVTSSASVDQLINVRATVANKTTDTFELSGITTAVTYTSGGTARYPCETMSYSPEIAIVALGTNDMVGASVASTALATLLANLETIVDTMTTAGTLPVLCTIPSFAPSAGNFPTPWGNQTVLAAAIVAWNAEIRTLALRKNVPLFDLWAEAGLAGSGNLYFQEEQNTAGYYIHFSVYGQERIASSIARFLLAEVAQGGGSGGPKALAIGYNDPRITYTLGSLTSHAETVEALEDTTSGLSDYYLRADYFNLVGSAAGAVEAFSFKFVGTGFVLLGALGDEGIITVDVDGNGGADWDLCQAADGSLPAIHWGSACWYRGLEDVEHTVTVSVKNALNTSATNYRFRFLGAVIETTDQGLLREALGVAQSRADANGAVIQFRKSRGPDTAANDADMIGQIVWDAKNDGSPKTIERLARIIGNVVDASDGAETGQVQVRMMAAGSEAIALTIGGNAHPGSGVIIDKWGNIGIKYLGLDGTLDKGSFFAWSDTDDTASSKLKFQKSRDGAKPSDDDVLGLVTFEALNDSSFAWEIAAFIAGTIPTSSNGASTGALGFALSTNGSFTYHTWMKGEEVLTCATTVTPNAANGNVFGMALTANVTTMNVPSNAAPGSRFTFRFVQDTSPRTVGWASGYNWAGGSAPTISAGSGAIDVIEVYTPDGTTFYETGRFQNQS